MTTFTSVELFCHASSRLASTTIPTKEDQTGRALLRVLHALQSASPVHLEAHAKNGQAPEARERRLSEAVF